MTEPVDELEPHEVWLLTGLLLLVLLSSLLFREGHVSSRSEEPVPATIQTDGAELHQR